MTTKREGSAWTATGTPDSDGLRQGCSFCAQIDRSKDLNLFHNLFGEDIGYDYILDESDDFTVMPSVGALVRGYSLIVPKRHLPSFGHLSPASHGALTVLLERVVETVSEGHADVVVFEHGPVGGASHSAGSCEDHAHLHVVPVPRHVDLLGPLTRDYRVRSLDDMADLRGQVRRGAPYLLLRARDRMVICDAYRVPSQYFRQQLASQLGCPDEWDWAVFPQRRNIVATIDDYRRHRR